MLLNLLNALLVSLLLSASVAFAAPADETGLKPIVASEGAGPEHPAGDRTPATNREVSVISRAAFATKWRALDPASSLIGPITRVATSGADATGCGTSESPCRTIQYALDQTSEGGEVRVAGGTYTDLQQRPRRDIAATGVVTQVVYLNKDIALSGGYSTANWNVPDPNAHPTVLDAQGQGRVLYVTGSISTTVTGVQLRGGDSRRQGVDYGGAGLVISATITFADVSASDSIADRGGGFAFISSNTGILRSAITGNQAECHSSGFEYGGSGGGVYAESSDLIIEDSDLSGNEADGCWSGDGGGGLSARASTVELSRLTVSDNSSELEGGGLILGGSEVTLVDSIISSNVAPQGAGMSLFRTGGMIQRNRIIGNHGDMDYGIGGGAELIESSPTLVNNLFKDNQASGASAVWINSSSPVLLQNTITGNPTVSGAAIEVYNLTSPSVALLRNTIIVSNTVGILVDEGATAEMAGVLWFANSEANSQGPGTISIDKAVVGNPAFAVDGYHLGVGSAAIDTGVDTIVSDDIDGELRPRGGAYDLGADEYYPPSANYVLLPVVLR